MLLSDRDIRAAVDSGDIGLDPFTPEMIQPASIDVRLDKYFLSFNNHRYTYVDPAERQDRLTQEFEVNDGEPLVLRPGEFVLGSTWEYVRIGGRYAARLEGKSSLGRLGILTHSTAGFIDPGFTGHITLELSNVSTLPVKLWPGMKIGQICFFQLSSPAARPYGRAENGSRYQGQRGPTASRSYIDFYKADVSAAAAAAADSGKREN
ncbi:MAG: dCTP deaminase [Aeriscardovia sp.]|nr:dCTP deaminase [Aeriscardovia sp.]